MSVLLTEHAPAPADVAAASVHVGRWVYTPKDRTKREHVGAVAEHKWQSEDADRVILKLADDSTVIGPGCFDQFVRNQQYRFYGRWLDGPRGTDFHFDTFTTDLPHFANGVVKYLADVCRGVGRRTALALWDKFGPDAVRMLREDPARVVEAGIMSSDAADLAAADLRRFAHVERTRVDLFGLLSGRGFPGRLIARCIEKYGVAAPDLIRRSPYRLMVDKLPGCSFRRCDRLYLDLGGRTDALKRQALAGFHAFHEDRTGSTWLDASECVTTIERLLPGECDPIRALRLLLRAKWLRLRKDGERRFVAIRAKADAEERVAAHLRRLRQAAVLWPADIQASARDGDGLPSAHQVEQLRRAFAEPVGAFCGGPGTGKTHTLAYAMKAVIRDYGRDAVCVCAPTGKAAVRAGESLANAGLDVRATTIHQLLEIGRNGHDGDGWGFQRNERRPLDFRFVFVEEVSMVDTTLLADLLAACADGTHVLFVGDSFQLAPVGHGAPLRDMLAGGIAHGELTEVRRNAGTIVRSCVAIKAGTPVVFDRAMDVAALDPANLYHVECSQQQVGNSLDDVLGMVTKFDRRWETQIVTGLNEKSEISRVRLNARLGATLNPDGRGAKGNNFRVGDKVICRRNQRLRTYAPTGRHLPPEMAGDANAYVPRPFDLGEGRSVDEWYVANGEIGRVVAVSDRGTIVRFGGSAVPLVWVASGRRPGEADDGTADGGKNDIELAWAITVHSSQGSEYPLMICLIDGAASSIADRNYWYTAISRAKRACIVIGPRAVFDRQVRRTAVDRRKTFLVELLTAANTQGGD